MVLSWIPDSGKSDGDGGGDGPPIPGKSGMAVGMDPPIPGKSGMEPPSPIPGKSGMAVGMGIGGSVPWSWYHGNHPSLQVGVVVHPLPQCRLSLRPGQHSSLLATVPVRRGGPAGDSDGLSLTQTRSLPGQARSGPGRELGPGLGAAAGHAQS